jgi:hypothetical protein
MAEETMEEPADSLLPVAVVLEALVVKSGTCTEPTEPAAYGGRGLVAATICRWVVLLLAN